MLNLSDRNNRWNKLALQRKCSRCLTGIDNDHDGNCIVCCNLTEQTAALIRLLKRENTALIAKVKTAYLRGVLFEHSMYCNICSSDFVMQTQTCQRYRMIQRHIEEVEA